MLPIIPTSEAAKQTQEALNKSEKKKDHKTV